MEDRYVEIGKDQELAGLIGIAAKSRKVIIGKEDIRHFLKSPKYPKIVLILATDISEGQKKDWLHRGKYAGAYIFQLMHTPKVLLAKLIGKEEVSAVAIVDEKIVQGLLQKIGIV